MQVFSTFRVYYYAVSWLFSWVAFITFPEALVLLAQRAVWVLNLEIWSLSMHDFEIQFGKHLRKEKAILKSGEQRWCWQRTPQSRKSLPESLVSSRIVRNSPSKVCIKCGYPQLYQLLVRPRAFTGITPSNQEQNWLPAWGSQTWPQAIIRNSVFFLRINMENPLGVWGRPPWKQNKQNPKQNPTNKHAP